MYIAGDEKSMLAAMRQRDRIIDERDARIAELVETCQQSLAIIEEFSCTDAAFRNLSNVELGKMVIDMKLKLARVIAGLPPMRDDEFSKLLQR